MGAESSGLEDSSSDEDSSSSDSSSSSSGYDSSDDSGARCCTAGDCNWLPAAGGCVFVCVGCCCC
jgi:hypothetical protein